MREFLFSCGDISFDKTTFEPACSESEHRKCYSDLTLSESHAVFVVLGELNAGLKVKVRSSHRAHNFCVKDTPVHLALRVACPIYSLPKSVGRSAHSAPRRPAWSLQDLLLMVEALPKCRAQVVLPSFHCSGYFEGK